MASSKDTFEAVTFGANAFACGTWRGSSTTTAPYIPGLQITVPDHRLHATAQDNRLFLTVPDNRLHTTAGE